MKWVIYLLLIANLTFFGWQYQRREAAARAAATAAVVPARAPRLVMLSELATPEALALPPGPGDGPDGPPTAPAGPGAERLSAWGPPPGPSAPEAGGASLLPPLPPPFAATPGAGPAGVAGEAGVAARLAGPGPVGETGVSPRAGPVPSDSERPPLPPEPPARAAGPSPAGPAGVSPAVPSPARPEALGAVAAVPGAEEAPGSEAPAQGAERAPGTAEVLGSTAPARGAEGAPGPADPMPMMQEARGPVAPVPAVQEATGPALAAAPAEPPPVAGSAQAAEPPGSDTLVPLVPIEVTPVVAETPPPAPVPAPARRCYAVGPVADAAGAEAVRGWLTRQGGQAELRWADHQEPRSFWVYLPPAASAAAAQELAGRLSADGVSDTLRVTAGPKANAISLGLYNARARAERRAAELKQLGYAPEVEVRYRDVRTAWIDTAFEGDQDLPREALRRAFPQVGAEPAECP